MYKCLKRTILITKIYVILNYGAYFVKSKSTRFFKKKKLKHKVTNTILKKKKLKA